MDNLTLALKLAGKETTTEQRSEQANPSSASIVYMIAVTSSSNGEVVLKDEIEAADEWEDAIEIDDDGDFEEYEPDDPLEDVDDSVVDMTDGDGVDIEDTEHETVSFSVGDYHEAAVAAYEEENEVSEDDLPDEDASISDDIDDGDVEEIPDVGVIDEDDLASDDETVAELSDSDYTLQDGDSNDMSDDVEGAEISDGYTIAECIGSIKAGDRVAVAIQDGKPVVIGVVGSGDEQLALMKHAQEAADEATKAAEDAQAKAEEVHDLAAGAAQDAQDAKQQADAANQAATNAQNSVNQAITEAQEAAQKALDAKAKADAVEENMAEVSAEVETVKQSAAKIRSDLETEIETVRTTAEQTFATKTETAGIETTLRSEFAESIAGIQSTFAQDFAKKTELSDAIVDAKAELQTQITQNANQILLTAKSVEDIQVDVTAQDGKIAQAQQDATDAQTVANQAKTDASEAQTAADEAKTQAQAANTAATNAQTEADEAKTKANQAQTIADAAKKDLATAQAKLAEVESNSAANAEDIAQAQQAVQAAQTAVQTAQAAADKAKQDAQAAQSTADQAKADAQTANTAAGNAQAKADEAKTAADNAQKSADEAKEELDALKDRVVIAETAIEQNSEAIALRATKVELTTAIDAAKTEMNAALTVKANEITSSVERTYATKTDLNNKADGYTILIYNGTGGNPKPVKFATVNYSTCNSENGVCIKISMVSGHGNGTSYAFLQDATIRVNYNGGVEVDNVKHYGANAGTYDGAARQYGDIFWVIDTTNKVVDFYVLMGQYARVYQTPWKRLTYSSGGTVTQYTSCTVYSSGTKAWANNSDIALVSDMNALSDEIATTYSTKAEVTQTAESIKSEVSATYQTRAAMGNYSTTAQMNSAINQKANEINLSVSTNYATKTALAETDSNISEHSEQLEDHETRISANEDAITLKVSSTEFNSYKTTVTNNISTAKTEAINAAATDATTKANNAKSQAISSAASDATNKANSAKTDAIAEAAEDATEKADAAEAAAISAAATDATSKANAAKSAAISTAATDATTKANNAKSEAITAAATDATNKANAALESAKDYTDEEVGAVTTEVTNVKKTVAEHTTSLSSITSRVATTETNITTINGDITSLEERMNAAELKITADAIISTVSGTYLKKTDASSTYATKTEVTQTASGLEAKITTAQNTANSANTAAGTAQSTANTARTEAANAAKTATNYLGFSSNGLVVGDMTASTLGNNVLIHTAGVDIRNNDTVLASYQANAVYLGRNNKDTVIDLCNGLAQLSSYTDRDSWNRLLIRSEDAIYLTTGGEFQQSVAYSPDYGVTEYFSTIRMTSHRPWLESNEMDGLPVIQLSSSVTSDDVSAVGSIYVAKDYLKLISEDHYGVKAYIDIMSANLKSVISISALEVEVGKSTENDILLKINEGGIATYTDVNVGGKRYNDGIQGVYIASDGYIQIQRNHSSYNPYISFHLNGNDTSTADAQICVQQSSGTMDFLRAEGYYFDNEVNVDSLYTQGDVKIGGKGYNDGQGGIFMDSDGYIQIQRNHSDYHPYISFHLNGNDTSTADGSIRVNQSTGYMEFVSADRYTFDSYMDVSQIVYARSFYAEQGIRIGSDGNAAVEKQIGTYFKDGSAHAIVHRAADGLTSSFGWAGSSSYATVTKIRGRTCQCQNSSGTSTLSDERLKKDFVELDAWSEFYDALEPCAFRMKNGTSGRYHMGFKAQQVEQALIDAGLSTNDFAGFIKLKYVNDVDDPEGNAVYEEAGINEGDDEFGLIYSEFTALNTYKIQKLQKRIDELEKLVNQLLPI